MGLLDDAIREHLELKRRHGADLGEVARQEAEALGPVRRGEVDLADRPVAAAQAPPQFDEPVLEDEPRYDDEPVAPEPQAEPAPEPRVDDEPAQEPEPDRHDHTPPHGDPMADQHTREFTAADLEEATGERPAAPAPPDRDVVPADEKAHDELEETPEFLQETPEHDRLWFEQKPPKDFDF